MDLIGPNEQFTVTGHSLGGHLAALAARLFPQQIMKAYAFNAPGFDPELSSLILGALVSLKSPVAGIVTALGTLPLKLTNQFVQLAAPWLPSQPASGFGSSSLLESEELPPGDYVSFASSFITNQQGLGAQT